MDKAKAVHRCSLVAQTRDNVNESTTSDLSQSMMSVPRSPSQFAENSSSSRDQNVVVDCIAAVRVVALYGVDGLLNYDLYFLARVLLCVSLWRDYGVCWWEKITSFHVICLSLFFLSFSLSKGGKKIICWWKNSSRWVNKNDSDPVLWRDGSKKKLEFYAELFVSSEILSVFFFFPRFKIFMIATRNFRKLFYYFKFNRQLSQFCASSGSFNLDITWSLNREVGLAWTEIFSLLKN